MTAVPTEAITVEAVARMFHEAYERLAPSHGYETRKASAVPWSAVPEPNRSLMIAVAAEVAPLIAAQAAAAERERIRQLAIRSHAIYLTANCMQCAGSETPHAHGFADLIGEERRLADGDGWDTARDRITEANQARADERERIATELEQRADGLDRHVGEWSDIGARHEVTTLAVTLRNTAAAIRANGLTENLRGDMDWR